MSSINGRHREPPRGRVDQRRGQVLRTAPAVGQAQHEVVAAQAVHDLRAMRTIRERLQDADRLAG
jgi:hypothetical protein